MNNSEFLQLVAAQGEVAQKALLLQECGVIKDVVITTRVSSVSTEVSVTLNQYSSDEMKWCAEQKLFGDDQTMHKDADNLAKLSDYCDNEVKKLQSRSQSIIDRIKNFVGFSK